MTTTASTTTPARDPGTVPALVRQLRDIAPDWTWTVQAGVCLVEYGTNQHPWGRSVSAFLVREPTRKTCRRCGVNEAPSEARERNLRARRQMDAAHVLLVGMGGQGKAGWFMAVPNKQQGGAPGRNRR